MGDRNEAYCVYKHTNKHNGKVYIGITCRQPEKRWDNGKGYQKNEHFYRAIKKYGWANGFVHEIVATGLDKKTACKLEIELIAKYNSTNCRNGYNYSTGGECGNAGCCRSSEWVQKMRKSLKKPIVCVESGITYESATDAEIQTSISKSSIGESCRNHQKVAGGFHWCFLNEYEGKRAYMREVRDILETIQEEKRYDVNGPIRKKPMGKKHNTK